MRGRHAGKLLRHESCFSGSLAFETDPFKQAQCLQRPLRFVIWRPAAPDYPVKNLLGRVDNVAPIALLRTQNRHLWKAVRQFGNKPGIGISKRRSGALCDRFNIGVISALQAKRECSPHICEFRLDVDRDQSELRTPSACGIRELAVNVIGTFVDDQYDVRS
ncbi:hypothetical protein [Sinorhizobium medicae]